jgi:heme/copper-type cytochrome/quinol oxidase subunit 4
MVDTIGTTINANWSLFEVVVGFFIVFFVIKSVIWIFTKLLKQLKYS